MKKTNSEEIQYKIQSIIFPIEEKHKACRKLFYKGSCGLIDVENDTLLLGYTQCCDFTTYLNACSLQKWKKYTFAKTFILVLEFCGDIEIRYVGYHKQNSDVIRTIFKTERHSSETRTTISFTYPDNNEQMVGFEITAFADSAIFGGHYDTLIKKTDLNDIVLCIATTTCRKEEFIRKNVNLLKEQIFKKSDELSKNLFLHVVDNGQTLTDEDIFGDHIVLHSNKNTGGSGGYARGMFESLRQDIKPTHILLMDDDVLVLPESIRRTFNILKLLRPEFEDSFISGAMLYYEDPERQHEDIGYINPDGCFCSVKGSFNHSILSDSLKNELEYPISSTTYAAWWYCCIPAKIIRKKGLPLPLFIRGDDAEYGVRCHPKHFITMNGICIWHMGFAAKYTPTMDLYQPARNMLIASSVLDNLKTETILHSKVVEPFRIEVLRFNYNAADLILRAFEDYIKGPKFLERETSDKLFMERAKMNPTFTPLEELSDCPDRAVLDSKADSQLSSLNRLFLKITHNGNRFFPSKLMSSNPIPVDYPGGLHPQRIARHSKILAVNERDMTGYICELDKKRYKVLQKRYKKSFRFFKKHSNEIKQEYKNAARKLTSEEFWKKYLDI